MALSYPEDYSGIAPTNKIEGEMHSVQPPTKFGQSNYIVPRAAPFFYLSLEVWTGPNKSGTKLTRGVDYFPSLKFEAGTLYLRKPIYGGIVFTNRNYIGNVYIDYQTLGGDFVINSAAIIEEITNISSRDIRFYTFDQIKGVPSSFPPDAHIHPVNDYQTMADLVEATKSIALAIFSTSTGSGGSGGGNNDAMIKLLNNHINNQNSAHLPSAVGLGQVPNYPAAIESNVAKNDNASLMTPAMTTYLVSRMIANEDLSTVRSAIAKNASAIEKINLDILSIQKSIGSIFLTLQQQQLVLDAINQEQTNIIQLIDEQSISIQSASNRADIATATAESAVQELNNTTEQYNSIMFARNSILTEGTHSIAVPIGTSIQVTLIGGGGGSGEYYRNNLELMMSRGQATNGGDSVIYFTGTRPVPVEPVPLLIAEGGKAGFSGYGDMGASKGGMGGRCFTYNANNSTTLVKVSSLKKIDLEKKIVLADNSTFGKNGLGGDTANPADDYKGVGGYSINATADDFKRTYGRGGDGTKRAGLGGSGGMHMLRISNDTKETVFFEVVVGLAGLRDSGPTDLNGHSFMRSFESHGCAIITLVA